MLFRSLFFALSLIVGRLFGWVAWRILRSQERHRGLRKIAASLPSVFAAYMLACAVVFSIFVPGEADRIFFGDIFEPLPNGYTLKALAKMPHLCQGREQFGEVSRYLGRLG